MDEQQKKEILDTYKWIKVDKYKDNPDLSWEERYNTLLNHHVQETTFLIEKIRSMVQNGILQENVGGSVLKISMRDYSNECGDGCCHDYGTITTVNGVQMQAHNTDKETIMRQVLEYLGYKVEIEYGDEDE